MLDPAEVRTRADLGRALDGLRTNRDLSYRAMQTASKRQLPSQTAHDAVKTGRMRLQTLEVFLEVCGVPDGDRQVWRDAWLRAQTEGLDHRRVLDADPYLLGVHRPIEVPGVAPRTLPTYVSRDVDDGERGTRSRVRDMAGTGGFLLIVGDSSVGKTRTAYEALRAELGGWELVHPDDVLQIDALTARPSTTPLVVWLDEIQKYLGSEPGLTAGTVRALLRGTAPVVLVGTLWPSFYDTYTQTPAPDEPDPYRHPRDLLRLADRIILDATFSPAESGRASDAAAAGDNQIATCLTLEDGYSLPQHLAAAPELLARLTAAPPYAKAVLTAAFDAYRLGSRASLPPGLLRAAADDYCTPHQQAEALDNWFEQALAYTTRRLHGSTSTLIPIGAGMGTLTGYRIAEYLRQHATHTRRRTPIPASLWNALRDHLTDPDDIRRIAHEAADRYQYGIAVPLLRKTADIDRLAAFRLAWRLAEGGSDRDRDELRDRANAGDHEAARVFADWLAEEGDLPGAINTLRPHADTDRSAAVELVKLLAKGSDRERDELCDRANAGDHEAARVFGHLLAEEGDLPGAINTLRPHADAGDRDCAILLAELRDRDELRDRANAGDRLAAFVFADWRVEEGDIPGAINTLRPHAADSIIAASVIADLLAEEGDLPGAINTLRPHADAGGSNGFQAAIEVVKLLAKGSDRDRDELRDRANAGDHEAALGIADLLAEEGDISGAIDTLRPHADASDAHPGVQVAAGRLAGLLAKGSDLDRVELRDRANAGDHGAARVLADMFASTGEDRLRRFGFTVKGDIADGPTW